MTVKNFAMKYRKAIYGAIGLCCFGGFGILIIDNAPIVKIGAHSTYTYKDLFRMKSAARAKSSWDAYQLLVLIGAEKEILSASDPNKRAFLESPDNHSAMVKQVISNAGLLGKVLETEQERLGDESFYKLYVEPDVVGKAFQDFYSQNDPKRKQAAEALATAKSSGLQAAATKGGQVQEIGFVSTQQNEGLMAAAKAAGVGRLIETIIEDGKAFYILQVKEMSDRGVKADAIVIGRTAPSEFVQAELKEFQIPKVSMFYSIYRIEGLSKPGMVFANGPKEPAAKLD